MLTKDNLKEIARFTGLKPYQQEKHYLQTVILHSLSTNLTNELIFKGGTALFFTSGLRRFSEDLDFTLTKPIDIDNFINNLKKDLELLGINNKITKIQDKNISISFKIGAEGPLFNKEIERCHVSIEISKREKVHFSSTKEIKSIYPDISSFTLTLMDEKEIVAEKIRAILTRNYARDLYDLSFLLQKGIPIDDNLVNEKLVYYNKKFDKKEFIKKIKEKKDIWEAELKPLIMGNLPSFKEAEKTLSNI